MITSSRGAPASLLGLAAQPEQDPACLHRAIECGINYFFFYSPGQRTFVQALAQLVRAHRDEIIVATGSGARSRRGLQAVRRKALAALGTEMIDVFFAEYIHPADDPRAIFGDGGVLDELQAWKADGAIRYVGATCHDRTIARQLAADVRVDVLMHRYNMAHRKAAQEVFPTALKAKTPVVAFTATRWGTLLAPRDDSPHDPPTAADCYRFCLAQPAVEVVLTAPKSLDELEQNLAVLSSPPLTQRECTRWQQYGDLVYSHGRDKFETQWP